MYLNFFFFSFYTRFFIVIVDLMHVVLLDDNVVK